MQRYHHTTTVPLRLIARETLQAEYHHLKLGNPAIRLVDEMLRKTQQELEDVCPYVFHEKLVDEIIKCGDVVAAVAQMNLCRMKRADLLRLYRAFRESAVFRERMSSFLTRGYDEEVFHDLVVSLNDQELVLKTLRKYPDPFRRSQAIDLLESFDDLDLATKALRILHDDKESKERLVAFVLNELEQRSDPDLAYCLLKVAEDSSLRSGLVDFIAEKGDWRLIWATHALIEQERDLLECLMISSPFLYICIQISEVIVNIRSKLPFAS